MRPVSRIAVWTRHRSCGTRNARGNSAAGMDVERAHGRKATALDRILHFLRLPQESRQSGGITPRKARQQAQRRDTHPQQRGRLRGHVGRRPDLLQESNRQVPRAGADHAGRRRRLSLRREVRIVTSAGFCRRLYVPIVAHDDRRRVAVTCAPETQDQIGMLRMPRSLVGCAKRSASLAAQ